jgi:hypothetical protein
MPYIVGLIFIVRVPGINTGTRAGEQMFMRKNVAIKLSFHIFGNFN